MKKQPVSVKEKQQQLSKERQEQKELQQQNQQQKKLVNLLSWALFIIGALLYLNTLHHQYALDDYSLILENKSTQKGTAALKEIFSTSYRYGYIMASDELYRPLSKAIFAIQWQYAPKNPLPAHFTNILLYALTGFLLMRVLFKYFKSVALAFIASLLFITHPIHTEVVANIKSLDEILGLFFNLLVLNFIYEYVNGKKLLHLLLAMVCFILALLSKESSVTYLAIFALAWYFFMKQDWKSMIKPMVVLLVTTGIFLLIRKSITGGAVSLKPSPADNLIMSAPDAAHRFATAIYIFGLYIVKLIFPHPLAFDYSFGQIPVVGMSDYRFLLSFLVLAGAVVAGIIFFRKKKMWVFGLFSFLAVASVVSNIFIMIGTNMGERLMYGPSLGFCIMVTGFISGFVKDDKELPALLKKNQMILIPLGIIVVLFSVKTITRNPVWENNYTLYTNDVKVSPNSTRTHYYLGNMLIKEDMLAGKDSLQKDSILHAGISELEKSVAIYPPFADAWNQMGVAWWRLKNFDKAKSSYETALSYNPNDATVHSNIGTILFETQNFPEAYKAFSRAVQLNPNYSDAWLNLGSVNGMMNHFDEAIAAFNRCIQIDPNNKMAYHFLGITYKNLGNEAKANEYFAREAQL